MTKQRIFGVLALLAALVILAWGFRPVERLGAGLGDSRLASARLKLPGRDGQIRSPEIGHPTLVHFWATWCPPCLDEFPAVVEYARRWEAKGLRVYAVSLDKSWEDADKFLNGLKTPESWVNVIDPTHESAEAFGSFQYPESYWVDRAGRVVKKWVGAQPWESPALAGATERFVVEGAAPAGAQ